MMRFLIALLLLTSCRADSQVLGVYATGINFTGKTVVGEGNSVMRGVAASSIGTNNWFNLFCTAKGATADDNGVDGATASAAGCVSVWNAGLVPTYNAGTHACLILEFGINDIGQNKSGMTAAQFKIDYESKLTTVTTTKGWPPSLIFILNTFKPVDFNAYVGACSGAVTVAADATRQAAFNTAISEIGTDFGIRVIDMYTPSLSWTSGDFDADHLHPNTAGHLKFANVIISLLGFNWWLILAALPTLAFGYRRGIIISMKKNKKAA